MGSRRMLAQNAGPEQGLEPCNKSQVSLSAQVHQHGDAATHWERSRAPRGKRDAENPRKTA